MFDLIATFVTLYGLYHIANNVIEYIAAREQAALSNSEPSFTNPPAKPAVHKTMSQAQFNLLSNSYRKGN